MNSKIKYLREKFDKVLDSHIELSSNSLKLANSISEERLLESLRKEIKNYSGNEYLDIENEIEAIEPLLSDRGNNKGEIKKRFKTIHDILVGATSSSISTGIVEIVKSFI